MQISDEEVRDMIREVGRKISLERQRRGMSMAHLAEIANLSVSHISKMESEQCEIGLRALLKISTAFGMKPEAFLPERLTQISRARTDGEKFEHIMQGADSQLVEFILNISNYMVNASRKMD